MAASQNAVKLRHAVKASGFALLPETEQDSDSLEVFRAVATLGPEAAATAQQLLATFESRPADTRLSGPDHHRLPDRPDSHDRQRQLQCGDQGVPR